MTLGEQGTAKDEEGAGCGTVSGSFPTWMDWGIPQTALVLLAGLRADV
jgi:hypothetical protein